MLSVLQDTHKRFEIFRALRKRTMGTWPRPLIGQELFGLVWNATHSCGAPTKPAAPPATSMAHQPSLPSSPPVSWLRAQGLENETTFWGHHVDCQPSRLSMMSLDFAEQMSPFFFFLNVPDASPMKSGSLFFLFDCTLFWDRTSNSTDWPEAHCVAEEDLEYLILLPLPPRCEPPGLVCMWCRGLDSRLCAWEARTLWTQPHA